MSDLLYSEIEEQLRASVRDLLTDRSPASAVLARIESDEPYDPKLWTGLAAELGVVGLAVDEAAGGQGASWRETAVVAEELGRAVAGTPFLGSAVLATALAQAVGAEPLLRALAAGEQTGAVVIDFATGPGFTPTVRADGATLSGSVRSVADAIGADQLIVPARTAADQFGLYLVDASAVTITPVVSLDLTRPLADVSFAGATARELATGPAAFEAFEHMLLIGAAMLASEQLGLAQRCLELTVDYLKVRYQFGHPVGQFQALKHRLADLWAGITQARAVARYAAGCAATGDTDLAVAAALAQAYCSPLAVKAAEECVQLHGGIGFTWEHPAHLYLKRAKADAIALGTASAYRARLGELVDLPSA